MTYDTIKHWIKLKKFEINIRIKILEKTINELILNI